MRFKKYLQLTLIFSFPAIQISYSIFDNLFDSIYETALLMCRVLSVLRMSPDLNAAVIN